MMKKSILLLISVLTMTLSFAQKGKVTSATTLLSTGDVDKAKEAIDLAMGHEKSKDWPKTYIIAGKVYTELYKKGKDDLGVIKAADYYKKAIALDKKGDAKGKKIGSFKKEIGQALFFFGNELINAGVDAFGKNDYKSALTAFEKVLDFNKEEYSTSVNGEKVDSGIIYNAALAAYNGKMWEAAEKHFKKTIEIEYKKGDAVILLHQVYGTSGDSTKMGENLLKGFEKFPEDDRIITELINYYLKTKQNDKALNYLDKAIEKDADNATFYFARGAIKDNSKDVDGAIADYKKAVELKPDYFNPIFNLGVVYFNIGVEQIEDANAETDTKKYKAKKAVAEETFKKALPYFEQAYKVEPDSYDVMSNLKTLYYRFGMNDKYNEIDKKMKGM